jgi:3-oxocholest-4-en-26-oate---CoA ligase
VGDAYARPLLDQLATTQYDLSSVTLIAQGGAPLSTKNKEALLRAFPNAVLIDGVGASETGPQAMNTSTRAGAQSAFTLGHGATVLSEDRTRVIGSADRDEVGWLAQSGRVPLGYLDEPERTAATFPTIDGVRYAVAGDRARFRPDGTIELLGRDSVTINTGGEKVFAEEVEHALKLHPAVVAGRPSERWGQEVVAVVSLRAGVAVGERELIDSTRAHLAGYKLPKAVVFRDEVVRSPSGKADYRWARAQITDQP